MKHLKTSHLIAIFVVLAVICACSARADDRDKTSEENVQVPKEKRPFCNAFAGCGRKRAQLVKEMQNIALGRALPYAYYTNTDLKMLNKLLSQLQQQKTSSEEDDVKT